MPKTFAWCVDLEGKKSLVCLKKNIKIFPKNYFRVSRLTVVGSRRQPCDSNMDKNDSTSNEHPSPRRWRTKQIQSIAKEATLLSCKLNFGCKPSILFVLRGRILRAYWIRIIFYGTHFLIFHKWLKLPLGLCLYVSRRIPPARESPEY
jgi:hypothetical protein